MQREHQPKLLGRHDLRELGITYSNPSLLRLEAQGRFPRRLYLSPAKVAWSKAEIFDWIAARAAERPVSAEQ
jgi:prophage regulatory protein